MAKIKWFKNAIFELAFHKGNKIDTEEGGHDGIAKIYRLDQEAELQKMLHGTENVDPKRLEELQSAIDQFDDAIHQLNDSIQAKYENIKHGCF